MATHYVICITKDPTHRDPYNRIQAVGTGISPTSNPTMKWSADQMIAAIEAGRDLFYCSDKKGDVVRVVVATHHGHKYITTKSDGIQQEHLLARPECK